MNLSVLAVVAFVVTLIGCAGDGADPSRVPNHPANPQSAEASYSPPASAVTGPSVPAASDAGAAGPCASKVCPTGQRCMVMGTPPAPMCM